ncbi:MAG TPA: polyprenyl synthetase family protein [Bacteroidota bacterium]|nr:polyprenyl synthetase family protein [Bacteroidota bacterium]
MNAEVCCYSQVISTAYLENDISLINKKYERETRRYKSTIDKRLLSFLETRKPASVYDPIRYVVSVGGKRVRSILLLLSCEAVGGSVQSALPAAVAIELFHNFTLVHDDVMDNARLRRGKPTVHAKWDSNVAILAGDELIALAYQSLLQTRSRYCDRIFNAFTDAFIQVCEGQGLDKEYEVRDRVDLDDYLCMIKKKTGRVIAAAAEIGALIGEGSERQITALRRFGEYLGRAFQVQDDILDIAGDREELGKEIGGDLKEGKKTYLLLKGIERTEGSDRRLLQSIVRRKKITHRQISQVREIYIRAGVIDEAEKEVARSTRRAQRFLASIKNGRARDILHWLSQQLLERNN